MGRSRVANPKQEAEDPLLLEIAEFRRLFERYVSQPSKTLGISSVELQRESRMSGSSREKGLESSETSLRSTGAQPRENPATLSGEASLDDHRKRLDALARQLDRRLRGEAETGENAQNPRESKVGNVPDPSSSK